ncbi:hypothetical protein FXO38_26776 [Capsicum annuum]|nr:hypothetical protein FXO38_26776 [Capsicum annuum]KAF3633072.1 hypothetical protein FXO37_27217 [Capsicum annuum]
MEDVRGDKFERISQMSYQNNSSTSDELSSGSLEVKTIKQLIECIDNVGVVRVPSYPFQLDYILDREVMFKVAVKKDNIDKHDEVYIVLKFSDDKDLIKQYRPPPSEDTCTCPEFNHEHLASGDDELTDSVAENDVISISNTPTKRSISENESYVVEIDDDPNAQLSTNKVKRVEKGRKSHE